MLGTIKQEEKKCRRAFQGIKKGHQVWLCHHDKLLETLTESPETRIDYILKEKPEHEQAIRLHEFRPVTEKLPNNKKRKIHLNEYEKIYRDLMNKYDNFVDEYLSVHNKYCHADRNIKKTKDEFCIMLNKLNKVFIEFEIARVEYKREKYMYEKLSDKYNTLLCQIHKKSHPDTYWNGYSIF
jgi:molecular chaperone GrpE (heat shock protein)